MTRYSPDLRNNLFVGQPPVLVLRIASLNWNGKFLNRHANGDRRNNKPSKLMISFVDVPSFNSCLFVSSSFRAILRT